MKKSLTAIIYLEPDQVSLRIVETPSLTIVTDVRSGALNVGEQQIANYATNMTAIVNNLEGFKQVIADYQVSRVKFYGDYADLDPVSARYVGEQLRVRVGWQIEWLNSKQLLAQSMAYMMTGLPEFKDLSRHNVYLLSIGLSSLTLVYFHHGNFIQAWDIDLGDAQINQLVQQLRKTAANPTEIIQDYISSKLEYLKAEFQQKKQTVMLVQNALALNQLFVPQGQLLAEVSQEKIIRRSQQLAAPVQKRVQELPTSAQQANLLLPNSLVVARTIRFIQPAKVYLTTVSMLDGISHGIAVKNDHAQSQIDKMIRTAADNISVRYGVDTAHRDFVTHFALQFLTHYDQFISLVHMRAYY